jgi:Leucine-rich repeat (LRR) protein
LTQLHLNNNYITDISALSGMTRLTNLDLGDNRIVDISTQSGMTQLTYLFLDFNDVVDLQPLVNNTGIGTKRATLYVLGNPLDSDAPIEEAELTAEGCTLAPTPP